MSKMITETPNYTYKHLLQRIDGLVQQRRNSIANAILLMHLS